MEDIRLLAINLDLISSIVQQAHNQAAAFNAVSRPVPAAHQVLGDFRETLNDCERLLDDQRYFTKNDGFVSNISFYYQTDPEVQKLRDRIVFHNIKVNRTHNEQIKRQRDETNHLASYQFPSKS